MPFLVTGNARAVTNEVAAIIHANARANITDHFDIHEIQSGFLVEAISTSGALHDCWIKVYVRSTASDQYSTVEIYSCNCLQDIVKALYTLAD